MKTVRVFQSGNSQAIRLPREFQTDKQELYIQKIGNSLILYPKDHPWEAFLESLNEFSDDFVNMEREDCEPQYREDL